MILKQQFFKYKQNANPLIVFFVILFYTFFTFRFSRTGNNVD
jgi:hypothetical protein